MVDQSPRFGLNTNYTQGEDDWSHNDTVNLLDELAEERDVIANRPASGDYDNEVFHATDENIYYRWDATNTTWVAVGGKGASGSPVPGTSHFESIRTGELNNVPQLDATDDVQVALNDAQPASTSERGIVRLNPDETHDLSNITLPAGTVLDIRGCQINAVDASTLFELRGSTHILGEGAVIDCGSFGGVMFSVDGDVTTQPSTANPASVQGYPLMFGAKDSSIVVKLSATGGSVTNVQTEIGVRNVSQLADVLCDGSGYVNNNKLRFSGSTAPPSTTSVIFFRGSGLKVGNVIDAPDAVQIKSGDHFARYYAADDNVVRGIWADPGNVSNAVVQHANNSQGNKTLFNPQYALTASEVNFGTASSPRVNLVGTTTGDGFVPQNLSGRTADVAGLTAMDDGTNTAGNGLLCAWDPAADPNGDGVAEGGWQPSDGSAAFA